AGGAGTVGAGAAGGGPGLSAVAVLGLGLVVDALGGAGVLGGVLEVLPGVAELAGDPGLVGGVDLEQTDVAATGADRCRVPAGFALHDLVGAGGEVAPPVLDGTLGVGGHASADGEEGREPEGYGHYSFAHALPGSPAF